LYSHIEKQISKRFKKGSIHPPLLNLGQTLILTISLETMSLMVIVKFSLLTLKISLLIFLQSLLIKRDLSSFKMNLELLILNLRNKSVYAE